MQVFKIKTIPFPGFITIIAGHYSEAVKNLSDRGFDSAEIIEPGDHAVTIVNKTDKGRSIAIVFLTGATDSIIWHECLHASWFVIDTFEIKIDVENHEILAYMQGYLYEQLKKRLKI